MLDTKFERTLGSLLRVFTEQYEHTMFQVQDELQTFREWRRVLP